MMEKNWIECEALILDIEKIKFEYYEYYHMVCGDDDDPSVLTQMSQRLLGQQMACDSIIRMLKETPGSDDA